MSIPRILQPKVLLALICAFFLLTRIYKISDIPPSVYWDEASIGYNAYAISQTGKDEWGEGFPLHFRAFGEFKLPVYIYSVVPFVKLFGLNAFSVRFPAVLFSLGVVILTYFLSKRLFGSSAVGLLAGFFVSVSSWFFIFSKTGYEATAGLMFYLLGIYLFLKEKRSSWSIFFSVFAFILSSYSYNSFRVLVPLTILILIIFNLKNLLSQLVILREHSNRRISRLILRFLVPQGMIVVILVLSVIPIYKLYVYDSGVSRMEAVSAGPSEYIGNYLSHFSLDFLLLQGDKNLRSQQGGFGQIYLPEIALFILGLIYIGRNAKILALPFLFLLLGPIPASITKESPHALRTISIVPFIALISAYGMFKFAKKRALLYISVIVIFLTFFLNYFLNFLSIYPVQSSKDWQYGYKQIFTAYKEEFSNFDRVIISDGYAQPYIFALFYQQINPEKFRQSVVRNSVDNWGFSTVSGFDKFEFGKAEELMKKGGKSLIFASSKDKIGISPSGIINFLDGTPAFWIYKI